MISGRHSRLHGILTVFVILCLTSGGVFLTGKLTVHAADPLKVVATFSILGDLIQNVGGDKVSITTLVGPGSDAHTFEPSPADSAALVDASVIFEIGIEFETWLNKAYEGSGSQALRLAVTEGIEFLPAGGEHADTSTDEQGEFDPHVWHDVNNVKVMVEHIRDTLIEVDPANTDTYKANTDAYLKELDALDAFVVEQVNSLPPERRKLVTAHDTFGYYAHRYGLEITGTALGVTTEASDPSAGEIAALIEEIKAAGVPVIFVENVSNPRLMENIASEAGVTLGPPLFTDALGPAGSDGDTYLKMIRYNTSAIVGALAGK